MDNVIFKVNGKGDDLLLNAIKLIMGTSGHTRGIQAMEKNSLGLCLYFYEGTKTAKKLESPLNAYEIWCEARKYLIDFEKGIPESIDLNQWEDNSDHDGSNEVGWLVYTGKWGHIGDSYNHEEGFAIKPVYLWHGK